MTYVIWNTTERKFVAGSGSESSFTAKLRDAKRFPTRTAADENCCRENEYTLSIEQAADRA